VSTSPSLGPTLPDHLPMWRYLGDRVVLDLLPVVPLARNRTRTMPPMFFPTIPRFSAPSQQIEKAPIRTVRTLSAAPASQGAGYRA